MFSPILPSLSHRPSVRPKSQPNEYQIPDFKRFDSESFLNTRRIFEGFANQLGVSLDSIHFHANSDVHELLSRDVHRTNPISKRVSYATKNKQTFHRLGMERFQVGLVFLSSEERVFNNHENWCGSA